MKDTAITIVWIVLVALGGSAILLSGCGATGTLGGNANNAQIRIAEGVTLTPVLDAEGKLVPAIYIEQTIDDGGFLENPLVQLPDKTETATTQPSE